MLCYLSFSTNSLIEWICHEYVYYGMNSIIQELPKLANPEYLFGGKISSPCSIFFRGMAACQVHDGRSVLLWKNIWNFGILQWKFPQLFSFDYDQNASVRDFLDGQELYAKFQLPLSPIASSQLNELSVLLANFSLDLNEPDSWTYIWGNSVFFLHKKFTNCLWTKPWSRNLSFGYGNPDV